MLRLCVLACARESLLPRQLADDTHNGREALAGHVAGRVAVRAPRPRGEPQTSYHLVRMSTGLDAEPPVAGVTNRFHVQLGTAPSGWTL